MPKTPIPVLIAASGLALAAASAAMGQSDPLGEPFPAVLDLDGLDGEIGFRIIGADYEHQSGWSMDAAGDVNGDGVDDLLLGIPGLVIGSGWHGPSGAAIVLYGRSVSAPFPQAFDLATIDGDNGFLVHAYNDDIAGYAVGAAGDINGDGLADVAVGAPLMGWSTGRGYVVYGQTGSVPAVRPFPELGDDGFVLDQPGDFKRLGTSLASVGDINGDGMKDLSIGAMGAGGFTGAGFVVFGRENGDPFPRRLMVTDLDGSNGFRIDAVDGSDWLGRSVAGAGDVNGDGHDDMVIGASMANPDGGPPTGAAYVVFGQAGAFAPVLPLDTLDGANGFRLDGVGTGDGTGISVSTAGDFNGDGVDDLIIGAINASPAGIAGAGAAYIVFGRKGAYPPALDLADLDGIHGVRLDGVGEYDQAGLSVAGLGDVNDDGLGDVAISGFGGPAPPYGSGVAYVVFGSREALPATLNLGALNGHRGFALTTAAIEDALGMAVSPAGDLNNDGVDDMAVSAPWASPVSRYRVGVIHIVYGRTLAAPCPADLDADGDLTIFDFLAFQNLFGLMDPAADFDGDGDFTIFDFLAFQNAFDAGC